MDREKFIVKNCGNRWGKTDYINCITSKLDDENRHDEIDALCYSLEPMTKEIIGWYHSYDSEDWYGNDISIGGLYKEKDFSTGEPDIDEMGILDEFEGKKIKITIEILED